MNNSEALVARVMRGARENLTRFRRYHDVIHAMNGLSKTPKSMSMAFEAMDGLIAVDVAHSSEVIFKEFHWFVGILKEKGVVSEAVIDNRDQAAKLAREALMHNRICDVIAALFFLYNYDEKLMSQFDWENVRVIMPRVISENKKEMYTILIEDSRHENGPEMVKKICKGAQNCRQCIMRA